MRALAESYFSQHPQLRFCLLAPAANEGALELLPFGQRAQFLAAERHAALCEQYLRLNHHQFAQLPLPRWVLSDLYLLPGAIGLLMGPCDLLDPRAAEAMGEGQKEAILAAYVGAPSLKPHQVIGVSLLSCAPGIGAGAWVKALTLRALGAKVVRGVAQWDSRSLRAHTRLGPLRVVGRVPGGHDLAERSFVYECRVDDDEALARAMAGAQVPAEAARIDPGDAAALKALVARAEEGGEIAIVAPGLDEQGRVLIRAQP